MDANNDNDTKFLDPNTLRVKKMDTNMYGLRSFYEGIVSIDCNRIKEITNGRFFNVDNINALLGEEINFEENEDLDFIPTDEAKIRIAIILLAAKSNIFILITGPTSSAKTFSVFVAYNIYFQKQIKEGKIVKKRPLRINLSEETSRDDLIGSIAYDEKKCQFIFQPGAFTEAYEKGYWLLIDELSLAPPSVLQAIQAALDSKHLTVQKIGKTEEIEMNKDFFLACTTNPNNEDYSRYILPIDFLDRFLCVKFDNLSNEEMKTILMRKCNGRVNEDEIQKIIDSHYSHTHETRCKNMYTLRELDKARFLFNHGFSSDQIIDILYKTRAGENLLTYDSSGENPFSDIDGFIPTENRKKYFKIALDCLKCGFNIILENKYNEGTSTFAEVIAKKFNTDSQPLIITMNEELHVSDITQFSVPRLSSSNIEIKKIYGIIYKAMIEGRVVIINDIERGKTRVIESLNDVYECNLLDDKSIKIDRGFNVHPKFRLIFTFHSNEQHKLSAAFFNRFIHIKMDPTGEISHHFNLAEKMPINIYNPIFPYVGNVNEIVENLCKNKSIAHTSQIETFYALTKESIDMKIPICFSSEIGYGLNLGIHLFLDEKYDSSKIHSIYCTPETSVEQLIGTYAFEGELLFKEGELLQAAINGDVIIFYGIEKLSYNAFCCLEAILLYLKDETREFIIPGFCVSDYKLSKDFRCLATTNININIENIDHKDIRHIQKYFHILPMVGYDIDDQNDYRKRFPIPTRDDYQKISLLNKQLYDNYSTLIENIITCFEICYEKRNVFDTTFRMFNRIISSIENYWTSKPPTELAICLFALFQNINDNDISDLLTSLKEKLQFDYTNVEGLIKKDVLIQHNNLEKGPLSYKLNDTPFIDVINEMSKEQLNATFSLIGILAPKILVGQTSFRETLIKNISYEQNVRVFNVTSDTSITEIIGGTSFKKNSPHSGRFGHGEIYDLLIGYMQTTPSMIQKFKHLDLHSIESFDVIHSMIDEMDDESLKPYFKYLFDIVQKESEYATFFELGFLVRELLLRNTVLLKNIDELKESILDSLIPFLNNTIYLKDCLPGDFNHLNQLRISNPSIFFTCSDAKYKRLPVTFRSRVQAIQIKNLTKDDLKICIDDMKLIEAYDLKIKDYSDIMRAINIIKIAGVLNNYDTPEERINIAFKIINQDHSIFRKEKKIYELSELVKYNNETHELKSLRTGAVIKVNNFHDDKIKELVYVPSLALLLDLTIISLATHIPLIIESSPGQAKSTFIRDFGYSIGKPVESNNMSKNKSSEEFIGKISPNNEGFSYEIGILYKQLVQDEIFLIDEFNLASSSLLSLFLCVFKAPHGSDIVHPHEDGPFIKTFDIVATMNPANLTADRTSLPSGFTSCSLIFKMPDYSENDNALIITKIFRQFSDKLEDYNRSLKFIAECHALGMKKSIDVTIRDILKLKEIFQSCQSEQISQKDIASYVELVYYSKMSDSIDSFDEIVKKYLGSTNIDKIPRHVVQEQYRLKKQIKVALQNTNRGLIIIGPSGCGKTHNIIELANGEYDGKKHTLHTIQLCAESDVSELLGRYEPLYSEKNELIVNFVNDLANSSSIKQELTINAKTILEGFLNDLSKPEKVDVTLEMIKKTLDLKKFPNLEKKINHFSKNWKQISFAYTESLLVKAMKSGDWVVLDNINLCSGDILESLNSLLEEKHILRLPNDDLYAMFPNDDEQDAIKIHPEFKLIMTSDDQNDTTSHIIPAPFLSRCIVLKIKKPRTQDLSKIGFSTFNISFYTDFMSKCFFNDSKSHVRDIIRMAKVCKFLHYNAHLETVEEIGKTIKFILNDNIFIPNSYKNSSDDEDNIYKFIITIFQTNLIDNNFENRYFMPFTLSELTQVLQDLQESDILCELFKETLKLACYVFSTIPLPRQDRNYSIQEKLITLLLCAYLITKNPKKQIPDFVWDLKFTPAIWDLVFVSRDEYAKFVTLRGFKQFMELHITEPEEFICEFYNYFKKNIVALSDDENINAQINNLFTRASIEKEIDLQSIRNKKEIEIEKLPISFPSIPNNRIILNDSISYLKAIEILDLLEITPSVNLLKIFNINIEEKSIFKEYEPLFLNTMNITHAQIYNDLFESYDLSFRIFKEIHNIPWNEENLLSQITNICQRFNVKVGDLTNLNTKFQEFCNKKQNKCDLTTIILDVLCKAENLIQSAFDQMKMKNDQTRKLDQNRQKANDILKKIQNKYIKEQITTLMETYINKDKLNEIIKLSEIDKYIMNTEHSIEQKYSNCKYLCKISHLHCREIEISVILAKFIIPAHCTNFQISDDIYKNLSKKLSTTEVKNILNDINASKNNEDINYHFVETLLEKMQLQPISMALLNSKEIISNIIDDMNRYFVFECIALDPTQAKEYIVDMLRGIAFNRIPQKYISHLDDNVKQRITEEFRPVLFSNDQITIDLLKQRCPSIPKEDFGKTTTLKYNEQFDDDSIAKLAHFITDQEIQKMQIEKKENTSLKIRGQNYQIISIESLVINLIYVSVYENIKKSLVNEFNLVDKAIQVLNPSSPQEILKKDIFLYISKINKDDIDENERNMIKENVDILLSSDNLDINNLSLNTLYYEKYRKRKVQFDMENRERNQVLQNIEDISNIIKENLTLIEANFKYLITTKTRKEIELQEGNKIYDDVYILAQKIFSPTDFNDHSFTITKNGEMFIKKTNLLNRAVNFIYKSIYSEDSLQYDHNLMDKFTRNIKRCKIDYFMYLDYADKIRLFDLTQLQMSEIYIRDIKSCPNIRVKELCDQILVSIKMIQEIGSDYQSFELPYYNKINIDQFSDFGKNISDLLIIGHTDDGIKLLNEMDYKLGKCLQNSELKMNLFNITNAKIKTEPETKIQYINDQIIISTKISDNNQKIKLINNHDNSLIGQINFNCIFATPKVYLMFSLPIKIENNSIFVRGIVDQELEIFIYSDTQLVYNILRIDDIDSEFAQNQVEVNNNDAKISLLFRKSGKFKVKMAINFPGINLAVTSIIIDVNVINKKRTFMYKINYMEDDVECNQRVDMSVPSYIAIKSPQIPEWSENIDMKVKINNAQYLHLAYVTNDSNIKTFRNNVDFVFNSVFYSVQMEKNIVPKLSNFNKNEPVGFGFFIYKNDDIKFKQVKKFSSIVKLNYEHDKLASIVFNYRILNKSEDRNYNENGLFYEINDKHNNNLDLLLDQIKEKLNIDYDRTTNFIIPWINIFKLFERTKEELIDYMQNKVFNNYKLKNDETYCIVIDENNINSIEQIPDEILSNKKIKSEIRQRVGIHTEIYEHLNSVDFNNLFEILENLDTFKSGLLIYRQIYDYKKEIAKNIYIAYQTLKSLGEKGIMLDTFSEIISIGNKLFNNKGNFNNIELIFNRFNTKSHKVLNFKKNEYNAFIFESVNTSIYGSELNDSGNNYFDVHFKKYEYKIKNAEELLRSNEYQNIYSIFTKQSFRNANRNEITREENTRDERIDDAYFKEIENLDLTAAQIEVTPEETDESDYPLNAYSRCISKKQELYSLTNLEKENENNFLPDDAALADGEIISLDNYVFRILGLINQSTFSLHIPNQHVTLLIDISQLCGSRYKNELAVNMMVAMNVLAAFEIPFSVWMFSSRNLCFCVKKPDDPFDNKRKCLIRDAYFLKRKNPDSYVLSAVDTVTRLQLDQKSNLFIIFSTFISSQTLRPYDEWKQIALSCTKNKHIICLMEPYQHTNNKVDLRLKDCIKNSEFIHVIKYTNICDSVKKLMLQLFALSKNFSKGSQSINVDSLNIQIHEFNNSSEFQDRSFYCFKNSIDIKKIKSRNLELKQLDLTTITGEFENIDFSVFKDFGDINYTASIMVPNKPTKFELSSHGYNIDIKGLINSYLSKFSDLKIFRLKTGEKIREYCADIIIDCSNFVKMYSVDHCFITIISLLLSLKDLNIPYVNLVIVGKHFVPLLVNQDLKYISNNNNIYSKIYSLLYEEASESRLLEEGLRQVLAHSLENTIPHIMFVITDAIFGQEHEEKIKDILLFAQLNGSKVIGIGTGPAPYRIEDIFSLSVYSKNPYMLRESLYQLTQMSITKKQNIHLPNVPLLPPIIQCESNTNEILLEQFSNTAFINDFLLKGVNKESLDRHNFTENYVQEKSFDLGAKDEYKGYKVLAMMFYEGLPDTDDKYITTYTFINGPKDERFKYITSPANNLAEKGFSYTVVTTYKDALNELLTGKYSISMLCTCSNGYKGNDKNDPNYLEPFLTAIVKFYRAGGALILFGENPPFIFEANLILQRLTEVNAIFDENEFDEGGRFMEASESNEGNLIAGTFLCPEFTFDAIINGNMHKNIFSIGAGLKKLAEGKTLAVIKTKDGSRIEDSFYIFSKGSNGKPACIFKVPQGREGAIFIDNGASKLYNEYTEEGAARYISNLSIGCIHYSHFRESFQNDLGKEAIKINMTDEEKAPRPTNLMKNKPSLIITILLDATDSMHPYIEKCKENLQELVEECQSKVEQLKIYCQVIAYRDFSENEENRMIESYPITDSLENAKQIIGGIEAYGGGDEPENISIGFEAALSQIEAFKSIEPDCKNIFILMTDSPNHDEDIFTELKNVHKFNDKVRFYASDEGHRYENDRKITWKNVWLDIDNKMKDININKLLCIDVNEKSDECSIKFSAYQYKNWKKYGCHHINKIVKPYILKTSDFHEIFVTNISNEVSYMYKLNFTT